MSYRTLSNSELTAHLDAQRARSPVIDELCRRLDSTTLSNNFQCTVTCCVCESKLIIDAENGDLEVS